MSSFRSEIYLYAFLNVLSSQAIQSIAAIAEVSLVVPTAGGSWLERVVTSAAHADTDWCFLFCQTSLIWSFDFSPLSADTKCWVLPNFARFWLVLDWTACCTTDFSSLLASVTDWHWAPGLFGRHCHAMLVLCLLSSTSNHDLEGHKVPERKQDRYTKAFFESCG